MNARLKLLDEAFASLERIGLCVVQAILELFQLELEEFAALFRIV